MKKGIPTYHSHTQFRSRLEARWAEFFNMCKWEWDYEPFDLEGYIPDFVLKFKEPLLVEIKPAYSSEGCEWAEGKIHGTSWDGYYIVLGASPTAWSNEPFSCCGVMGVTASGDGFYSGDASVNMCPRCREFTFSSIFLSVAYNTSHPCLRCGEVGTDVAFGMYSGHKFPGEFEDRIITPAWREAGNRVQWRPS